MKQYIVTGMSCAACSARVEKAVSKVAGVTSCSVSLLTNSMGVEGNVSDDDIAKAVQKAGYGIKSVEEDKKQNSGSTGNEKQVLKDMETPILKRRLLTSIVFLVLLMYISMGYVMWGFPLPELLAGNSVAIGIIQMLLTIIIMIINQKFFIKGFGGLIHGAPNMDTLVALGSTAAFVYSTYALFAMTYAQLANDYEKVMHYMHEFYFESAAMILTLITLGKMLETRSKGKTTDAIRGLMNLAPKTACIIKDGQEIKVPVSEVKRGDVFVVKPGESIPVDGVLIEGSSAVDESALTGESIPIDKGIGDNVSAATMNQFGYMKCEAVKVGEDTTLSQIIKMVSDAAASKAPIAKVADRVSGVFVPVVIAIAVVTILAWLLAGESVGFALARGISVLVISCPCALGLATPVAIMVGNGMGAKNGIMFKTALSLEETGKADIVVLDKTGTITKGEPKVTDIIPVTDVSKSELLRFAYSLEQKSEHPLAKAIIDKAKEEGCDAFEITDFKAAIGNGLTATYEGKELAGGNLKFIAEHQKKDMGAREAIQKEEGFLRQQADRLSQEGKTPLFFALDGKMLGLVAVADVMKEESPKAISELKNMGLHVVMLTGDNEKCAKAIGKQAGVDEVIAGVLPDGKEKVIRSLKEKGKVIMVGDGINDAPALVQADMGIAIGAGTDIAIDAADIVLMKSSLLDVTAAIRLSRQTLRNIHQNLFWAFFYNIIGIPLAAGVWYPVFGILLNPMFGAAAMSLSSFCVVSNALRLNWFQMYNNIKDKKKKHKKIKEKKEMTKTMKIEGMMCGHCEARVKKVLEALDGVKEAIVSHEKGEAQVIMEGEISNELLKETVEAQDYKVLEIQ